MWQNNERKARFIAAALSGDRTIRTIDDIGEAANQFALAKAIASGDARLMQKAGLEGEIARLDRQRAAHFDDQLAVRRRIADAEARAAGRTAPGRADRRGPRAACLDPGRCVPSLHCRDAASRTAASPGALLLSRVRLGSRRPGPGPKSSLGTLGGFELALQRRADLAARVRGQC